MDTSQSIPFQYRKLPGAYIRLVVVQPGIGDAPLQCSVFHRHILQAGKDTPSRFNAVSYTWGDPTDKASLQLLDASNGHAGYVVVTKSLIAALMHFRHPQGAMAIWADQLCINQSDTDEKETQIGLMKMIYERAGSVMAWLGPAADDSDLAMDKLADAQWVERQLKATTEGTRSSSTQSENLEAHADDDPAVWAAIHALLMRPWWSRTWIWQEASAQILTQTLVCCGEKSVMLHLINLIIDAARFALVAPQDVQPGLQKLLSNPYLARFTAFLRQRQSYKIQRPLLAWVENARDSISSDPRDKLYAMLTFGSEGPKIPDLRADYSKSPRQAYVEFVLWHIGRYRCLDIFGHCVLNEERSENVVGDLTTRSLTAVGEVVPETSSRLLPMHLPTWVPDWTRNVNHLDIPKLANPSEPASSPLFNASGVPSEGISDTLPRPIDTTLLELSGLKLGVVAEVSTTGAGWRGSALEQSWQPADMTRECDLNGIPMGEVFRRTILTDTHGYHVNEMQLCFRRLGDKLPDWPISEVPHDDDQYPDIVNLKRATGGRRLFYTSAGLMGLAVQELEIGDELWLLRGGRVLYALRPVVTMEEKTHAAVNLGSGEASTMIIQAGETVYELVGEAFMLGLMDGEALEMIGESPKRPRPRSLQDMDQKFRDVRLV